MNTARDNAERERATTIDGTNTYCVRYKQAEKSLALGRSVIKFSDISKPYCFVFIRRKVHFKTVTLQRCYKYDDREKAMRCYLDVLSEAKVGENWTCVHTKWRSFFADLGNISEFPVLKMQKHVSIYWSDSAKNPGGRQDFNREVYINFMLCGNVATGR